MIAGKYEGPGFIIIIKSNLVYCPIYSKNHEDFQRDLHDYEDLPHHQIHTVFSRVNLGAFIKIDEACKHLNKGGKVDLEHILD